MLQNFQASHVNFQILQQEHFNRLQYLGPGGDSHCSVGQHTEGATAAPPHPKILVPAGVRQSYNQGNVYNRGKGNLRG